MKVQCTCGTNSRKFSGHMLNCAVRAGRPNLEDMLKLYEKVLEHDIIRPSCLTCFFFDEKSELCILYKQRPPARVIAFGCISWEDSIPF